MILRTGLAAFLLLIGAAVPVRAQSAPESRAATEVRALERAWLDAYEKSDVAAMDRIVASDFRITFPDGSQQDKAQILAMIRAPRDSTAPAQRFFTEDVQARVQGDMVVLSGIVVTETRRQGGTPQQDRSRYTDTYVRRDGRWQVFASHLSNAPDVSPNVAARRWVKAGRTIVSPVQPPLRITVDPKLTYIGSLRHPLGDKAEYERFVFADFDSSGPVRALFIAQFESLLPAASKGYDFPTTKATRLGAHDYQTDTGRFNFAQAAAARPSAEADRTRAFLERHGLVVGDDDFLAARYSRITDSSKRNELILFYYENLAVSSPGADVERLPPQVLVEHEARARSRFSVVDGAP